MGDTPYLFRRENQECPPSWEGVSSHCEGASPLIFKEVAMNRARMFLKRILTPVTILLVPHSRTRSVSIRVPVVAVAASVCLFLTGTVSVVAVSVRTVEYHRMQARLSHVSAQFLEMKGTMLSLQQAEKDFRKLFSLKSKTAVLESADPGDTGSLDMEVLRKQIEAAMQSVSEIAGTSPSRRTSISPRPSGGLWLDRFPRPTDTGITRCTRRRSSTPVWTSPSRPAAM